MKNNPLKKSLSVFLAVLMLLTSWVWVAPEKADAAATLSTYRTADKYGTPYWDGSDVYTSTWNSGTSFTTVKWPKHIYLDVSENLQSAGYYYKIDWRYGNNTDYRIIINGFVFGGWKLQNTSSWPASYNTMNNLFNNYDLDASLPDGVGTQVYDFGNTSGDLYVGVSNWDGANTIIYRNPNANAKDRSAYVFMKGTPKAEDTGRYSTSGKKPTSFGGWQQWRSDEWKNASDKYVTSNDSSNWTTDCYEGKWKEVAFDITIYDKSDLKSEIDKAQNILTRSAGYEDLE